MTNYKTTILGILTIVAAVCQAAIAWLSSGHVPDLTGAVSGIISGLGLILAADGKA